MAHLREYYYNGGNMLELAEYQHEELPVAVGAENDVLSFAEIMRTEIAGRSKKEKELGKYSKAISNSWSSQTQKRYSLYINHWF